MHRSIYIPPPPFRFLPLSSNPLYLLVDLKVTARCFELSDNRQVPRVLVTVAILAKRNHHLLIRAVVAVRQVMDN